MMESQDYEQEQDNRGLPAASPLLNQMASALQEMTKTENDIKNFQLFLENKYIDETGEKKTLGEPLVNSEGLRKLMGIFKSMANPHYILGDTTDDQKFNNIIDYISEALIITLLENKKSFDIKDMETSNLINHTFMQYAKGIIGRGAGERPFWTKITMDYNIHNAPQKKEGMLSGLFKK